MSYGSTGFEITGSSSGGSTSGSSSSGLYSGCGVYSDGCRINYGLFTIGSGATFGLILFSLFSLGGLSAGYSMSASSSLELLKLSILLDTRPFFIFITIIIIRIA